MSEKDAVFTEFGQAQVCRIAREKAERVASRNSMLRYNGELLLGFLQMGAGLGLIFGLLLLLASPFIDISTWDVAKHVVGYGVATYVLKRAQEKVRNPEVNFSG